MIASHSVEQSRSELLPQVVRDLVEGRFDAVDGCLQGLLLAGDGAGEQALGDHCASLQAFARQHEDYRGLLPAWKQQFPMSAWPDVLACLLWENAANRARGEKLAEEVAQAQWQRAHLARDALFIQAMDLAQRHGMPWVVAVTLMRNVLIFDEPDWLEPWLKGAATPAELAPLSRVRQAVAESWPNAQALPELPASPARDLAGAMTAHPRGEDEPEAFFWLRQALQASPVGHQALQTYAFLRTPRWGGSHEEIIWLADSPLAGRLDEQQRNAVRLIAWLDDIDSDNVDVEDEEELQAAFLRGQQILARPLPALARARVNLALGELACMADRDQQAMAYHAQAVAEAPSLKVPEDVLYRMLCVGVLTGMGEWLGQVTSQSRMQSAFAAVLYGVLCDTGWCGVQRDAEVAAQWYRHALSHGPLPVPEGECPFNDVYYAFDESLHATALRHMVECAAALGVPEMQFALAYLHEEHDPATALHWYRQAGAHGFGRALYNLSLVCDRGVEQGGLPGFDVAALRQLGNDCEVRCLELLADQQQCTPRELERIANCFIGMNDYLADHKVDSEQARRNLAVLRHYAKQGWPEAMRILSRHYRAEDCPQGHDYPRAVYWCEQACQLQPDDEQNIQLRQSLSQGLLGAMRYRRALAKVEMP
ncbi:DUF4034 domain-containing protein [Pseudomonas fulva]|nr:DUF4034 domain-containing protein [Pseudomonas fulva]MBF8779887.1 DUF4034 domain-containing protein [Pseudomonas fulva]